MLRRQVVYTGEGAAPLLRVVNTTSNPDPAAGAPLAPCGREEHLVPFVREIVPAVDADARVALLQAPPGLLELGRRRALLEGLRPQLLVRLPSEAHAYVCVLWSKPVWRAADTARAAGVWGVTALLGACTVSGLMLLPAEAPLHWFGCCGCRPGCWGFSTVGFCSRFAP